jgi:hypothetical protein
LTREEALFYRDRLRAARYSALADAEGFLEICFAIESLGIRLLKQQATLGKDGNGYEPCIRALAQRVTERIQLELRYPGCFSRFQALYETLRKARNDAMHTGSYARHATSAAIELCIYLEEALMATQDISRKVSDYMVKAVIQVERWHPVAHARQLMLTHSFSFLPVYINGQWKLLSELSIARFLPQSLSRTEREKRLGTSIEDAAAADVACLCLLDASKVKADSDVDSLLTSSGDTTAPSLWLVPDENRPEVLLGILTPFELM